MLLQEKTIIITGASSGIGAAAAKLFASNGANVVMGSRRGELLHDLSAEIAAAGGAATYVAGDVGDEQFAAALVNKATAPRAAKSANVVRRLLKIIAVVNMPGPAIRGIVRG